MASTENPQFILRHARLFSGDAFAMGDVACRSYHDSNLGDFLNPGRKKYPQTWKRNACLRIMGRMCSPVILSIVACPASSPSTPIGTIQIIRNGDNVPSPAMGIPKLIWPLYLAFYSIVSFVFRLYLKTVNWMSPDLSESKENLAKFNQWNEVDDERYWKPYKERWHVVSCVVAPEWQRKGVGMALIEEIKRRAREDKVVAGLEATTVGTKLYEKAGFEKLGEFYGGQIEAGGGIYIWTIEKQERDAQENGKKK